MPADPGQQRAILKPADSASSLDEFIFQLNPSQLERGTSARYAEVASALDDAPARRSGPDPLEWTGNRPHTITLKFTLHYQTKPPRNGQDRSNNDVEDELDLLDRYERKEARTGEPPRLIFRMGQRSDLVRIESKTVTEKIYTSDLRVQWADVSLSLKVLRSRI